jgi:predicted dithiol-disulfide oxidoreductase (DUF899 family)
VVRAGSAEGAPCRGELVVYKHMWHDGAPHQGQCEGCTTTAWHVRDAVYLNVRGVSFGPWQRAGQRGPSACST